MLADSAIAISVGALLNNALDKYVGKIKNLEKCQFDCKKKNHFENFSFWKLFFQHHHVFLSWEPTCRIMKSTILKFPRYARQIFFFKTKKTKSKFKIIIIISIWIINQFEWCIWKLWWYIFSGDVQKLILFSRVGDILRLFVSFFNLRILTIFQKKQSYKYLFFVFNKTF